MSRLELLAAMQKHEIALNEAASTLFAMDAFTTAEGPSIVESVEIAVADLGLARAATTHAIHGRALQLGMALCPLELGPHLRLQYRDQPEGHVGHPRSEHRAPPGSLTIASAPLGDDEVPKGFYLRRIHGVLWLRGYRSGPEHLWSPEDRFVFMASPRAARSRAPR
jgi:hypothetical protein